MINAGRAAVRGMALPVLLTTKELLGHQPGRVGGDSPAQLWRGRDIICNNVPQDVGELRCMMRMWRNVARATGAAECGEMRRIFGAFWVY